MDTDKKTVRQRTKALWILCVLFGAGVLVFARWFGGVIPTTTCSGPLPAAVSALMAYQLSRTPADSEAVFGRADDPCRIRGRRAQAPGGIQGLISGTYV